MCVFFLCYCESNIINYFDNTNFCACEPIYGPYIETPLLFLYGFRNNYLKANSGKSHLLATSDNVLNKNVRQYHLFDIPIHHKVTFEDNLFHIIQKLTKKYTLCKNINKYSSEKVGNYHESISYFTICILLTNLDVSWQSGK